MPNRMPNVSYDSPPPPEYRCAACGQGGVKLWRGYSSSYVELLCVLCASREQQRPCTLPASDQIGWYVPAVPCETTEGDSGWWGYTAFPERGCRWWRELPLLPVPPVSPPERKPDPPAT